MNAFCLPLSEGNTMRASIFAALGVVAFSLLVSAPADAFSYGTRSQRASNAAFERRETMDQCVRRQTSKRDPVSGIAIQLGDAQRFCNRRIYR